MPDDDRVPRQPDPLGTAGSLGQLAKEVNVGQAAWRVVIKSPIARQLFFFGNKRVNDPLIGADENMPVRNRQTIRVTIHL